MTYNLEQDSVTAAIVPSSDQTDAHTCRDHLEPKCLMHNAVFKMLITSHPVWDVSNLWHNYCF